MNLLKYEHFLKSEHFSNLNILKSITFWEIQKMNNFQIKKSKTKCIQNLKKFKRKNQNQKFPTKTNN
jgi:hypothetical protein